jgi:hypothetical protein
VWKIIGTSGFCCKVLGEDMATTPALMLIAFSFVAFRNVFAQILLSGIYGVAKFIAHGVTWRILTECLFALSPIEIKVE